MYIYLGDIGPDWTITHPEALARLPGGYHYTIAGSDGAWTERDDGFVDPPRTDW